ncbi:amino acid/amide ABC transporter ATP-binding protein 2, HAAT family (TC 3.A.1.4.-) [Kaistia soli DSM 19436]|uniref:Amino acid/amide ABC transporter ATP-binding protein 2, HAAT family (TC 3.A.1.4.-) n=1 Tax=Kaistia soli DSM 19436 TaxID=1122133 RepID=A0A1M5KLS2_9HYPH|nr:ABC transporter ATP-binding protein [Kaistia soli]SHG53429.1 amino acid/amide ABC transporter ATP-binding protein 2, HAAT family (TC 3.A.1.4.-) [Kaistia soli DSM 19436]
MSLLEIRNLDVRHGLLQAVRGVDLSVEKGETIALVGANGAGKTTLLRAIAGAHLPAGGNVRFGGTDITLVPSHSRVGLGIALVPEGRRLFSQMTVEENLILARSAGRKGPWTLDRVFEAFPNLVPRRKAKAGNLSGGEQQATAIGRALMTNPEILLLDEVSLGLSPLAVDRVYASLDTLIHGGTTIVLVEQDLRRAMRVADRIVCMLEGKIVLEGKRGEITREQVSEAYFGLGIAKGRLSA